MADSLEPIIEWNMTEQESFVYKIGLLYINTYNQMFPKQRRVDYPKIGDPRKSNIFRHCWKLVRETKGILKQEEYKLYIKAQLQILKTIGDEEEHAHVDIQTLCGPKAWKRWKLWKKRYDQAVNKLNAKQTNSPVEIEKIKNIISKDKSFLKNYSKQDILKALYSKELQKWLDKGQLSYYYIILSPIIKEQNLKTNFFSKDLTVFLEKIDDTVVEHFKKIFFNEYE